MEILTPYHQALTLLQEAGKARRLSPEIIHLKKCLGRVLANDLQATESHPPWNCSAMDGFAVSSKEIEASSLDQKFKVLGVIAAGDAPKKIETGGVWEIMTGAPLPPGTDAVIKIEDAIVTRHSSGIATRVQFQVRVPALRNVRLAGEDFHVGKVILKAGQILRSEDILCLATLGITEVEVRRKLKVGLISTGLELVDVSKKPEPGQIRNSSAWFLERALMDQPVELFDLGIVRDKPEEFEALLQSDRLKDLDLIISTGAISMGQFDFVGSSLEKLQAKILFRKVQVRPAKPILLAELPLDNRNILYLGLPGQPVSSAVGLRFFFGPLLGAALGLPSEQAWRLPLMSATKKTLGFVSFLRGRLETSNDGALKVSVHPNQQPSMMSPLLDCNVWIMIPEEQESLAAGELVSVYPF